MLWLLHKIFYHKIYVNAEQIDHMSNAKVKLIYQHLSLDFNLRYFEIDAQFEKMFS